MKENLFSNRQVVNALGILSCALLVIPMISAAEGMPQKPSEPNVFLITIDTLRADHVHCYGDEQVETPALDSLAKDGIVFFQAFTPSPITNTSHASILTGLLPSVHGVTAFRYPLPTTHQTLAELLKKKGYGTAAFIASIVLDSNTIAPGLDRGFDFYDNFPDDPRGAPTSEDLRRRDGKDVVQHAEDWLNANPAGPRFIWVHLYDVHAPYKSPQPYSSLYKGRAYDGAVAYADSILGGFLVYLKRQNLYGNSLIIVVADHGEGLGEHGEESHGVFLYDSTTRVPLIVKLPNQGRAGSAVRTQVSTTDILPTVLQLLNIPAPSHLNGQSLAPYISGTEDAGAPAFGETDYPLSFGWAPLRSVRAEGFKLIEAPRPELYDLRADPGELRNIYEPWSPEVQKLRQMMVDLPLKPQAPPTSNAAVRPNTIAELQALGYWSPADARTSTSAPEPSLLPDPKDKVEELGLFQSAGTAIEEGRIGDGRIALERILQMDPTSLVVLRRLAPIEVQAGDKEKGAELSELVGDIGQNDAEAAYRLANSREKAGDWVGAREALEVSLSLTPDRFPVRLMLGDVCLHLSNPKAAEIQFHAALLLEPGNTEAELDLAKSELAASHYHEAIEQLQPLSISEPRNAEIFNLLAQAYLGVGDKNAATKASQQAGQLMKSNEDTPATPSK